MPFARFWDMECELISIATALQEQLRIWFSIAWSSRASGVVRLAGRHLPPRS